jgi:hypothetical protein
MEYLGKDMTGLSSINRIVDNPVDNTVEERGIPLTHKGLFLFEHSLGIIFIPINQIVRGM